LGHPRAEWILLPRRAAAFWEGPKGFIGRNRESRRREAAGRRNYPEAVPKERSAEMNEIIGPILDLILRGNARTGRVGVLV